MSKWLTFKAKIEINGINPYVHVSAKRAQSLREDWRGPMPVLVQIDGMPIPPWKINMVPDGHGNFFLYLHTSVRTASQTEVGNRVTVRITFDALYKGGPAHPLPPWFAKSLAQNSTARDAWDALPPSRKKEVVRYFAALKSTAARERNLRLIMDALRGKKVHFLGRDWVAGK